MASIGGHTALQFWSQELYQQSPCFWFLLLASIHAISWAACGAPMGLGLFYLTFANLLSPFPMLVILFYLL